MEEEDCRRREKEAEAGRRKLEEEALAKAARREAEGDSETAELILEHAIQESNSALASASQPAFVVAAPIVQAEAPKVRGVGFREVSKWHMRCGMSLRTI